MNTSNMISGARMNKIKVVEWLTDNGYSTVKGFTPCCVMMDLLDQDEFGNVDSSDVYAIFEGGFPGGANIFRTMTCTVVQYLMLEKI